LPVSVHLLEQLRINGGRLPRLVCRNLHSSPGCGFAMIESLI
jgi:hypothetical protein